jgi:hypothetical protein
MMPILDAAPCTVPSIVQMAAFFVQKAGGTLLLARLPPLLYLAERRMLQQHAHYISFDTFLALPQGPILSRTLAMALYAEGYHINIARPYAREALPLLSDAAVIVMQSIHDAFQSVELWALRKYTQVRCPEWCASPENPRPLADLAVLLALGHAVAQANLIVAAIEEHRQRPQEFT